MFFNKVAFLMTISNNLKFITAKFILNRSTEGIIAVMGQIKNIYTHRVFCIIYLNSKNDFEPLQDGLKSINTKLNTIFEDENVLEIERCIQTIKERTRSTRNMSPFRKSLSGLS